MADYYEVQDEETSVVSYDISVIPNDFNVMTINSLIESGVISMPTFQRNYVWDRKRASRFIESLILGLPIPQIFLYQIERNKYSIIDGQQRLLTIYFFVKQRFPRSGKRTLFDWKANNTNAFWKLFGEATKDSVRQRINSDDTLKTAEQSFIELGRQRNLLVHENFAEFDVNITVEEIYKKYRAACGFIALIEVVLDPSFSKK